MSRRFLVFTPFSCHSIPATGNEVVKGENKLFDVKFTLGDQIRGDITQVYRTFTVVNGEVTESQERFADIRLSTSNHVLQGVPLSAFKDVSDAPEDCITPCVKQCNLCGGTVDRFAYGFECRKCTAMGDLFTGIMTRLDREYYENKATA